MVRTAGLLCFLLLSAFSLVAHGEEQAGDGVALQGVEVGRIIWDVTQGDPALLSGRLAVVRQTYEDLKRQQVRPDMVFAFRGGAVLSLNRDLDRLPFAQRNDVEAVQQQLAALLELPGVRMEACQIAMRRVEMTADDLIPGVHQVGNTFLSLMGFAQRGYVTIPLN